jgi:hypothetical protein
MWTASLDSRCTLGSGRLAGVDRPQGRGGLLLARTPTVAHRAARADATPPVAAIAATPRRTRGASGDSLTASLSSAMSARMFTATLIIAIVLPALMLGHMAHEEIQSQKAYRSARLPARR